MIFPKCEGIDIHVQELDYWSNCFYIEFILKFQVLQIANSLKTFFTIVKYYLHRPNILRNVDHLFLNI